MNIGFNGELVPHTGSRAANVTGQKVDPSMLADIAKAQPQWGSLWKDIAQFGQQIFQASEQIQEADYRVDALKAQEDYQSRLTMLSENMEQRQLNGEFDSPKAYFQAYEKGLGQIRADVTDNAYGTDVDSRGYFRNKEVNKERFERMIESMQEASWRQGMAQYIQAREKQARVDIKYRENALKNMSWSDAGGALIVETAASIAADNPDVPNEWKDMYASELIAQSYSDDINRQAQQRTESLFGPDVYTDIKNTYLTLGEEKAQEAIRAYVGQLDAIAGAADLRFGGWDRSEELGVPDSVARHGDTTVAQQRSATKKTLATVKTDLVDFLSAAQKEAEAEATAEVKAFANGKKSLGELSATARELAVLSNPELLAFTEDDKTEPGSGEDSASTVAPDTKASLDKGEKIKPEETELSPEAEAAVAFGANEETVNAIQNGETSLSDFVNTQVNGFVDQELVAKIPEWLKPRLVPYKLENGAITYALEDVRESLLTQLIYDINTNAYSTERLNEYRSTLLTGRMFLDKERYATLANAFVTHMRGSSAIPKGTKEAELRRAKLTLYHRYNPNDAPDKDSLEKFFKSQCGEAQLQALNALVLNAENCGSAEEMRKLVDQGIEDIGRIADSENAYANIMAYADSIRFYTSDYTTQGVDQAAKRDNAVLYFERVEPLLGQPEDAIKKALGAMSDEELAKIKDLGDARLGRASADETQLYEAADTELRSRKSRKEFQEEQEQAHKSRQEENERMRNEVLSKDYATMLRESVQEQAHKDGQEETERMRNEVLLKDYAAIFRESAETRAMWDSLAKDHLAKEKAQDEEDGDGNE